MLSVDLYGRIVFDLIRIYTVYSLYYRTCRCHLQHQYIRLGFFAKICEVKSERKYTNKILLISK